MWSFPLCCYYFDCVTSIESVECYWFSLFLSVITRSTRSTCRFLLSTKIFHIYFGGIFHFWFHIRLTGSVPVCVCLCLRVYAYFHFRRFRFVVTCFVVVVVFFNLSSLSQFGYFIIQWRNFKFWNPLNVSFEMLHNFPVCIFKTK